MNIDKNKKKMGILNLKVDVVNKNDKKEVGRLYYQLHPEFRKKKPLSLKNFKAKNKIFVAREKGKVIGFIWVTFIQYGFSKMGYIEELYVEKEKRRKAVGSQLVNKALDFFRKLDTEVIFLSVSKEDKKAIGFYEKLEFNKCQGYWLYRGLEK